MAEEGVGERSQLLLDSLLEIQRVQTIRDEFAEDVSNLFEDIGGVEGLQGILQANDPNNRIAELRESIKLRFVTYVGNNRGAFLPNFQDESEEDLNKLLMLVAPQWLKLQLEGNALPKQCAPFDSYPDELYYLYLMIAATNGVKLFEKEENDSESSDSESKKRGHQEIEQEAKEGYAEHQTLIQDILSQNWKWNSKSGNLCALTFIKLYSKIYVLGLNFGGVCALQLNVLLLLCTIH